jgi:dTDP-glucose 4,6-dehydratase
MVNIFWQLQRSIDVKNYLITGGAGFIGSHFIELLLNEKNDITIYNLDKLTYAGKPENMPFIDNERHVFIHGDICDSKLVSELFKKYNFDIVVNFAAESHVDNSIADPNIFMQTNILGVVNLLNCAKNNWVNLSQHLFVQISTDEVYGSLDEKGSFFENSPIRPNSPYSASKASADLIVMSYFRTFKLPVLITRSSNNFGPRQDREKLIPKTILCAISGEKVPIYGTGLNIRDWIYVKDNCNAIIRIINLGQIGEVYNIGGSNEKTNIDIVGEILLNLGLGQENINFIEDRLGHDFRYSVDVSKTKDLIGSYNLTEFSDSLKLTIAWYSKYKNQQSF